MTRFEALGCLPDKRVTMFTLCDNRQWITSDNRISPEQLVDSLTAQDVFTLISTNQYGFVIEVSRVVGEKIKSGRFRASQTKIKRNAKRFNWSLPTNPASPASS